MNILKHFEPIGEQFEPVSSTNITEIETKLGRKLPEDYQRFLKTFGRCGLAGDAFVGPSVLCTFLGGGSEAGSLLKALEAYEDLTADGKLVIADDMAGNPYVLDPVTQKLFFIDFTSSGPVPYHVANNFSDFLSKIDLKFFES